MQLGRNAIAPRWMLYQPNCISQLYFSKVFLNCIFELYFSIVCLNCIPNKKRPSWAGMQLHRGGGGESIALGVNLQTAVNTVNVTPSAINSE